MSYLQDDMNQVDACVRPSVHACMRASVYTLTRTCHAREHARSRMCVVWVLCVRVCVRGVSACACVRVCVWLLKLTRDKCYIIIWQRVKTQMLSICEMKITLNDRLQDLEPFSLFHMYTGIYFISTSRE